MEQPRVTQWEYKIINQWMDEYEMNPLGNEGWNLMEVLRPTPDSLPWYIFKRPKHVLSAETPKEEKTINGFMPCEECSVRPACKAVCKDCITKEQPKEEKPTPKNDSDGFILCKNCKLHRAAKLVCPDCIKKEQPCTCPFAWGGEKPTCPKHDA